jgi:hypothetical protein
MCMCMRVTVRVCVPACGPCSPYATDQFPVYAEEIPGDVGALDEATHPTTFRLHALAKRHGIYLIGGGLPPVWEVPYSCSVRGQLSRGHLKPPPPLR